MDWCETGVDYNLTVSKLGKTLKRNRDYLLTNLDNLAFSLKSIFLYLCATFWILSLDQSSSSWTFSSKSNLPLDLPLTFQLLLFFIFIILIYLFFNMLGHSLYVSLGPHIFKLLIYSFLNSVYITQHT